MRQKLTSQCSDKTHAQENQRKATKQTAQRSPQSLKKYKNIIYIFNTCMAYMYIPSIDKI